VEETRVPAENQWPVASHWQLYIYNSDKYILNIAIKSIYKFVPVCWTCGVFIMAESNFGVGIGKTIHFVLWCSLRFPHKNDVPRLIFTPFVGDHALAMLLVSIYVML
jgi:hypothetical protein